MPGFEFIDHTADFGIRVSAPTQEELFIKSAQSMFSIITESRTAGSKTRETELCAYSLEELLVNWLNELISLLFAEKFLPCDYSLNLFTDTDSKKLRCLMHGQFFDPYKREIKTEIKAATHHRTIIKKVENHYIAEVIFDV